MNRLNIGWRWLLCAILLWGIYLIAGGWQEMRAQVIDSLDFPVSRQMLSIDLGGIATNNVSLRYHHAIDSTNVIGTSAGFVFQPVGNQRLMGYQLLLHYRYYPDSQALWRLYLGGHGGMQRIAAAEPDAATIGGVLGAVTGWQYFPLEHFAVGAAIGLQHSFGRANQTNPVIDQAFGLQGIFMFDLGYAWGKDEG